MSDERYDRFKEMYGDYSSLALWKAPSGAKGWNSKEYIDEIDDIDGKSIDSMAMEHFLNKDIKYIFVGLNPSKQSCEDCEYKKKGRCKGKSNNNNDKWSSFHSACSMKSKDYKLRYALKGTKYWGAFITDLYEMKESDSNIVNPSEIEQETAVKRLVQLRSELGGKALIIAMHSKVYNVLERHKHLLEGIEYIRITHYSYRRLGNLNLYRSRVLTELGIYDFDAVNNVKSVVNEYALLCECVKSQIGCSSCPIYNNQCAGDGSMSVSMKRIKDII